MKKDDWISVKVGLPKLDTVVLCTVCRTMTSKEIATCRYVTKNKWKNTDHFEWADPTRNAWPDVIAWMPLPEEYTERTETIRCKDCMYCVGDDDLMCLNEKAWVVATDENFGCVYAERK